MKNIVKASIVGILLILACVSLCFADTSEITTSTSGYENILLPINSYQMNNIVVHNTSKDFLDKHVSDKFSTINYSLYAPTNPDLKKYENAIGIGVAITVIGVTTGLLSLVLLAARAEVPSIIMSILGFFISVPIGTPIWATAYALYKKEKKGDSDKDDSLDFSMNEDGIGLRFSW